MKTCSAITGSGEICRFAAKDDTDYCRRHQVPTIAQQWTDKELQAKIIAEAEKSVPWELVAMAAGVPRKAIRQWRDTALKDDCPPDLAEFVRKVDQAAAKGGMVLHAIAISSPNASSVASARWMLERRFPDLYGPQQAEQTAIIPLWEPFNADEILQALNAAEGAA